MRRASRRPAEEGARQRLASDRCAQREPDGQPEHPERDHRRNQGAEHQPPPPLNHLSLVIEDGKGEEQRSGGDPKLMTMKRITIRSTKRMS